MSNVQFHNVPPVFQDLVRMHWLSFLSLCASSCFESVFELTFHRLEMGLLMGCGNSNWRRSRLRVQGRVYTLVFGICGTFIHLLSQAELQSWMD